MDQLAQLQVGVGANAVNPDGARRRNTDKSWFEVMANAWGRALDAQGQRIIDRADGLDTGEDRPSDVTMLTTEALRMQFLSNSSHTALTSMGSALETMARKQ